MLSLASAVLACAADEAAGPAADLRVVGAGSRTGVVFSTVADTLVVQVVDEAGRPVPSVEVQWSGDGSFAPQTAISDRGGRVRTVWTLGTRAGGQTATATALTTSGQRTATFTATAQPVLVQSLDVTLGTRYPIVEVGRTAAASLLASDRFGNVLPSVAGASWSVTDSTRATVSAAGIVTGRAQGRDTLVSTVSGVTARLEFFVVDPFRATAVAVGRSSVCALDGAGTPFCFADAPTPVDGGIRLTALSSGGQLCGLTPNGVAECTGDGATLRPIVSAVPFVAISVGLTHACALDASGRAFCWGQGALGDGTAQRDGVAGPVAGGLTFRAISAGDGQTCAVTTDDRLYCWRTPGADDPGLPAPAGDAALRVRDVSAGTQRTCVLTTAGRLLCDLHSGNVSGFAPVDGFADYVSITGGWQVACGLTAGGVLRCSGRNEYGALGDGRGGQYAFQTDSGVVVTPPDGSGWRAVAALRVIVPNPYGSATLPAVCGISGASSLYCWGGTQGVPVAAVTRCLRDSFSGASCVIFPAPMPSPTSATDRPLAREP